MADTFSHTSELSVPLAIAWTSLQDPMTWGSIAGVDEIRDAQYDDDGTLAAYAFTVNAGVHRIRGSATTAEIDKPARMRLTISSAEMAGWIQATLAGDDQTASVTVDLSMRPKGLLATMFYPIISQTVGREFAGQVQGFADRLNDQAPRDT